MRTPCLRNYEKLEVEKETFLCRKGQLASDWLQNWNLCALPSHPALRQLGEGGSLPAGSQKAAPIQVKSDFLPVLVLQVTLIPVSDLDYPGTFHGMAD